MNNFDLFLNSHGDISFEVAPKEELEQFVFNFHYATSDSLLLNFFTDINGTKKREPDMLQFNFNTYTVLYDKKNRLISDDDYIKQAIKIQLETELDTLRENEEVGSNIYKYRHMFMNPTEVIMHIEECAYDAIKDIVPDCEVKVYLRETDYYDFYNAIKISVIFKDKTMWFTL
jgi:phage baseplate assembly protein W